MTEIIHGRRVFVAEENLLLKWWESIDQWTLISSLILILVGLLLSMAASVPLAESHEKPPFYYVYRQLIYGLLSCGLVLFLSIKSISFIRRFSVVGFFVAISALILLPFFGTDFGKGAIRWFSFDLVTIQPSEFLKPFFIVFIAWIISGNQKNSPKVGFAISFITLVLCVFSLIIQPDLGQTVLIVSSWAVIHFVIGISILFSIFFVLFLFCIGAIFFYHSEHVADRLINFFKAMEPTSQIGFVEKAIQSGGFLGVGAGNGKIKWSLADAHTDFIIAVAIEEFGLILFLLILSIFLVILFRSVGRLMNQEDPFLQLSGIGLLCLLEFQAVINLGVAARLLPTKGMTLPFISYGGSSMIATGILVGLLINITKKRTNNDVDSFLGGK